MAKVERIEFESATLFKELVDKGQFAGFNECS